MASVADREVVRLLEENRHLSQELKQCQADKDFVWSLWKKLQVSNPDVTQAVGLVVQREREKSEIRDRRVLEILQRKDERISELQSNLAYKARELGESTIRQTDVQDEVLRLQRQIDTLQDRNANLELQLRNVESREKNLENVHSDTIQDYEKAKRELSQKVQRLTTDLEKMRSEKADEMALRVQMESKVRVLDKEVEQKISKFEDLVKELEEARSLLRRFESQARQQKQDLEYKNQELETVRRELAELWTTHNQLTEHSGQQADLIRQIQSLQTDTQKMMKNQEEAYNLETNSIQQMYTDLTNRYDLAKQAESELRSNVLKLKKELLDKDDAIAELQHKLNKPQRTRQDHSGSFLDTTDKVEPVLDLEYKVQTMQKVIDNLRRKLIEKEGQIEQLEEDAINQTIEFDVARLNRHERTHSTPSRQFRSVGISPLKGMEGMEDKSCRGQRSRSMSPTRSERPRPRYHVQKELEDCKAILKLKIRELNELKKAHQKRQERLKSVQENYKNVKEQLKTLEAEFYGSKKKQKKPKRVDPKELRHEDSTAVWNELAYFKNENRNLMVERMTLDEELDSLRVQASENAATIHELRVTLEQEREERAYEKKKTERNLEGVATQRSEVVLLKSEVQNKDVVMKRLERDLTDVRVDRDALQEEKKLLKQEIMELKQEASQHRMDQADLKRDILRLKRELEEERNINKIDATKAANHVSKLAVRTAGKAHKKSQRSRNSFNLNASRKFEELIEEGWEEMSEDSEKDEDTDPGVDSHSRKHVHISEQKDSDGQGSGQRRQRSLGGKLLKQSTRARCAASQHVQRLQETQPSTRHVDPQGERGMLRDIGTSPMTPSEKQSPSPRRTLAHNAAIRQLQPMKQRVGYLQQQVIALRDSRAAALKTVEELKESNTQLQTDLSLANQRLRVSKQSIQKLNADLDKLHQEKKEVESKLSQRVDSVSGTGHTDHDWKIMESRLKSCSNELTRQNNVVRQLKQDNEQLTDQVRTLQDKVSRAERDSSQKRSLLEDQRSRVKQALESAKADAESLEQLETRTKLLQETNDKQKIQIDSYKKRLGAVTREKRDYEERFLKLTAELEKKNKILLEGQLKKQELETSLSDMEKLATQQMKSLARESEEALETAKEKLRDIGEVLQAYQRFVRNLAQEILRRTQHTRATVKEQEQRKAAADRTNASMQRAQDLAKDILNLSQSDLDDIMSADGERNKLESELEIERRKDKKWSKRVEKVQNSKDDFALALMDLFLQKIEERVDLMAKLHDQRIHVPEPIPAEPTNYRS